MKSVEQLSGEMAGELLQMYAKYRNEGMPGSAILGVLEDLKLRLVAQKMLRAAQDSGSAGRRPVSREFVV